MFINKLCRFLVMCLLCYSVCGYASDICNKDNPENCYSNGVNLLFDQKASSIDDQEKAFEFFVKVCKYENGRNGNCNRLAKMYRKDEEVAEDFSKAAQLYNISCEYNNAFGCLNLGIMYFNGNNSFPKNAEFARKFIQKACDLGNADACQLIKTRRLG